MAGGAARRRRRAAARRAAGSSIATPARASARSRCGSSGRMRDASALPSLVSGVSRNSSRKARAQRSRAAATIGATRSPTGRSASSGPAAHHLPRERRARRRRARRASVRPAAASCGWKTREGAVGPRLHEPVDPGFRARAPSAPGRTPSRIPPGSRRAGPRRSRAARRALRPPAAHRGTGAKKFAVVASATASSATPFRRAISSATWRTNAGSLVLPRCGTGAR